MRNRAGSSPARDTKSNVMTLEQKLLYNSRVDKIRIYRERIDANLKKNADLEQKIARLRTLNQNAKDKQS